MNLNPAEWSKAQDLLLKLVQVLSPLTDEPVAISLSLRQRFFNPRVIQDPSPIKCPVHLLTTLHSLQSQVEEWIGTEAKDPPVEKKGAQPPLSKQAQKLIGQVQEAIGKLCNSTYMKDPQEAPLRNALKRLKPELDQIITAVSHEGMHSADDEASQPFRFSEPRPLEKTSLPIVPFSPITKALTPARKKKKRKGFWFRDDEERSS